MRQILLIITLVLLVVGCDSKKSEVNSVSSSSNTGEIIDGYFIGAWFKIKVPTNFSVKPSLKSEALNTPTAFDSVLFVSPDKEVEFYVYFPKLMGRPTDFEFSKNNEKMASESKTGDSKKTFEYSTYTAKDKSYTKSLVVITSSNTTNYAFGVKYKNQIAYDRYKTEYLEFKKSLVENRNDSKKESTSNNTQSDQITNTQAQPEPNPTQQSVSSDSIPQIKHLGVCSGYHYSFALAAKNSNKMNGFNNSWSIAENLDAKYSKNPDYDGAKSRVMNHIASLVQNNDPNLSTALISYSNSCTQNGIATGQWN